MKQVFLLLLYIIPYTSMAQDPKYYYIFAESTKQVVFYDGFENDKNKWLSNEPSDCDTSGNDCTMRIGDTCYIDNGIFHFSMWPKEITNRLYVYEINTEIDFNRNFDIEFKARIDGDDDNFNAGTIYWGRSCNNINGQNIYFGTKNLRIFYSDLQFADSVHPDVDKLLPIPKPYQGNKYNTYTIRKFGKRYYVFINTQFIGRCPFIPLKGNVVGLGKTINYSGEFDYIKISYLPD